MQEKFTLMRTFAADRTLYAVMLYVIEEAQCQKVSDGCTYTTYFSTKRLFGGNEDVQKLDTTVVCTSAEINYYSRKVPI